MIQTDYTIVDFENANRVARQNLYTENDIEVLNHYANSLVPDVTYQGSNNAPESSTLFTIVDTFPSRAEAKNAVLEMQQQGLRSSQIVLIAKKYQEHENSMNWEYIADDGGLVVFLTDLGINVHDTFEFVSAVENGKFLVVAIVTDRSAYQAQRILENIGRKVLAVY